MASTATLNVLEEVGRERIAQDEKWGGPNHDDQHGPGEWANCIIEHLAFALRDEHAGTRQEFIRVSALAVAAVEAYDRMEARNNGGYIPEGHELGDPLTDIPF